LSTASIKRNDRPDSPPLSHSLTFSTVTTIFTENTMLKKIKEYDKQLRKRLIYLLPVSLLLLIILLVSLEKMRVVDRIFSVGYEGPMQILPQITILDDSGIEADVFEEERHDMVAREVEVYSEEIEDEDDEAETSLSPKEDPEEPIYDDFEGHDAIRTYESHASVPYREDYIITKMVEPVYPPQAMLLGHEGYVLVEVYVNNKGVVQEAWVRKTRGDVSFEEATLDAVNQFEFRPVMDRGNPIPFWLSFLVRFELN
jgi:TonB family protein